MNIPHDDDDEWFFETLKSIPRSLRHKAVIGYSDKFLEAYNKEEAEHRKEQQGRREANLFFLAFKNKYSKALRGFTIRPPLAK